LFFSPHAIDLERFKNFNQSESEIRKSLKISNSERIILFAGKFIEVKNLETLIENFLLVNNSNLNLVLVGSGLLEDSLRAIAKTSKRVHFLPFFNQTEMPQVYSSADCFVLPSKSETWGLSVNEAKACGLPILVSENCGCEKDLLKDGENGFVIKENNILDCLIKVSKLSTKELENMSEKSKEIISNYSYFNAIQGIKAAIRSTSK
jgi:glycosyltransferase involved in cell wall biosynthesis